MAAKPGSFAFVRWVVRWSIAVAVAVAVIGGIVTRDWRFPLSLALGAVFDIGAIVLALRRAPADAETLVGAGNTAVVLLAASLPVKAVLLGLAVAFPAVLDFWGMVAGVLVFELTLMTLGSFSAARDLIGSRDREGGVSSGT